MSPNDSDALQICEVGPRDGLQNEPAILSVDEKVHFVERLAACGLTEIEVGSFVRPDVIPQLADSGAVFKKIQRVPGVTYSALVPNLKGLEHALEAGVDKVAVFTSASEGFAESNIRSTIQASIDRFREVVVRAHQAGMLVRGYVSCVIKCPYDGPTDPRDVRTVCDALLDIGIDELDLGDTIGVATPDSISRLYDGLSETLRPSDSVLHLHDTNGRALECARRAFELGVRRFDASCGGLGGCPFAPGASGNLATEALVEFLDGVAGPTGVDGTILAEIGTSMRERLAQQASFE